MVDILVLGSTGFTGKHVMEYLYNHPQRISPGFTIAAGGRSKSKLDALAKNLGLGKDVELWPIDVTNEADVEKAVRSSKVVISTVGPFWKWGKPVVAACARNGVHYVDLTGEPHFILDIIEKFDHLANKNDAIIIPACGFDSVPSDIAVYLSNKTLKSALGPDASIEESLTSFRVRGSVSGGTIATAISFIEDVPRRVVATATKAYALSPQIKGPPNPPNRFVYTMPFSSPPSYGAQWPMRIINRQVVQRTWSLFEAARRRSPDQARLAYGNKFRYDECIKMPGYRSSIVFSVAFGLLVVGLMIAPFRWLFKKIAPKPGQGTLVEGAFMNIVNVSSSGRTGVRSSVRAKGDPGYIVTSHMIAESALSLVLDFKALPYHMVGGGGILTPMSALGDVLIRRLRDYAEFTFESEVVPEAESKKDM